MKAIFYWIIAALAIVGVVSCNDSAGVGGSLAEEDVVIVIDSNFTVTASDVRNNVVLPDMALSTAISWAR